MKAMTQSALALVSAVVVASSLAACNRSPDNKSSSMTEPNTASTSSTMSPTSSTPSAPPASTASSDTSSTSSTASTGSVSSTSSTTPDKMAASDKSATPGKGNATPGNDDAALTAQGKSALQSEPSLRAQSIDVDTKNATVTLTGSVDSAASKAKANEVAAGVNGVVAVVDHITVKAS